MIKLPFRRGRINIKAFHLRLSHKSGFGLISLLIAIGVMGLILAGVMESLQNNLKAQKKFEELSDMVELRRVLRSRIDCAQSKAANPGAWNNCNGNLKIKAVDVANNIVINDSTPITSIGSYSLEMRCTKSGTSGNLKISMIKTGSPTPPVTTDLFKKVPIICN
jgi:type II secretory pathway pseudopilin PulG